jgi:phage tail sheath protein FI
MPFYNGFDGFEITEADPLRNTLLTAGTPTDTTSYVYYTLNKAIDTVSDPETLVTDLVSIPGLTYESLTTKLVQTCESRADALAVIDLPDVYIPEQEQYYSSKTSRYAGTTTNAANALKARGLNSSYGTTYYPWVQIRDTISNQLVFVPPSVVALGAMSYGQRTQELWFAPAGFTRGGLTEGRGGVPVLGVTQRLSSTERDTLYEANINPIAQFPSEGIVIFGQKTLQVTPSALDRINVRRLLIYLKREVSRIASGLLFDQNVDVTWSRFLGQVNPFLSSVKSRLGLSDYRVILDKTTTTPDLVDRNIMYAKVYLKPARSIEFIAIDFTITDSGASFAD